MTNAISLNPKLQIIGSNNNRTEYLMKGKKVSVGNQDRCEFELNANKYLNGSDKYNKFKANHSLGTSLIGLTNLLIIGGATFGGVKGTQKLMKKYASNASKALNIAAATLGGLISFVVSGEITQYTGVPGRKSMKDAERQLKTLDIYFPDNQKCNLD